MVSQVAEGKLKLALILLLIIPVLYFSIESFRKYRDSKVSISTQRDNSHLTLPFPSVTVCSGFRNGFLTPEKLLVQNKSEELTLEKIRELTYNRSEFLTYFTQAVDNDFSINMVDNDEYWTEEIHEYYGGRCYTFNPPVLSKPGETNAIIFGMRNPDRFWTYRCDNWSSEDCHNQFPVFFHPKDAFIFNKGNKFVGQSFLFPEPNKKLMLTLTHRRINRLNLTFDPCQENGNINEFKRCILKSYDEIAGCRMPWTKNGTLRVCNGSEVHERFISKERNLWWDVDRTVTETTKCLKPCSFEIFEWQRTKYAWEGIPGDLFPDESKTVFALQIFYVDTTTEITEEFVAYDGFNMVGETGGALGLFLGWSCFQLLFDLFQFSANRFFRLKKPLSKNGP